MYHVDTNMCRARIHVYKTHFCRLCRLKLLNKYLYIFKSNNTSNLLSAAAFRQCWSTRRTPSRSSQPRTYTPATTCLRTANTWSHLTRHLPILAVDALVPLAVPGLDVEGRGRRTGRHHSQSGASLGQALLLLLWRSQRGVQGQAVRCKRPS